MRPNGPPKSALAPQATHLLHALADGDDSASSRLLPLVYEELKAIAIQFMQAERVNHTLQATALVHEAYMKLVDSRVLVFNGRQHFIAVAARAMRRLLVNHARDRKAQRRGGGQWDRITLDEAFAISEDRVIDVLDLDEAIQELGALNQRQGRLSELRFFGGLEVQEAAEILDISLTTAKRDWTVARAWLARKLVHTES